MFFRTRQCTRVHRSWVQKHAKLEKRCVFGNIDKFWKGHEGQIKTNACKKAYLGSIFIPEKYVFRVCFESPFTRMISSLKYKWHPWFWIPNCDLLDSCLFSFLPDYSSFFPIFPNLFPLFLDSRQFFFTVRGGTSAAPLDPQWLCHWHTA